MPQTGNSHRYRKTAGTGEQYLRVRGPKRWRLQKPAAQRRRKQAHNGDLRAGFTRSKRVMWERQVRFTGTERHTLRMLTERARLAHEHEFDLNITEWAEQAGLGRATLHRHLDRFAREGFLRKQGGRGAPVVIVFLPTILFQLGFAWARRWLGGDAFFGLSLVVSSNGEVVSIVPAQLNSSDSELSGNTEVREQQNKQQRVVERAEKPQKARALPPEALEQAAQVSGRARSRAERPVEERSVARLLVEFGPQYGGIEPAAERVWAFLAGWRPGEIVNPIGWLRRALERGWLTWDEMRRCRQQREASRELPPPGLRGAGPSRPPTPRPRPEDAREKPEDAHLPTRGEQDLEALRREGIRFERRGWFDRPKGPGR